MRRRWIAPWATARSATDAPCGWPRAKRLCVESCPLHALDFGPIAELRKRYGTCADLPPLPASDETYPNLAIALPVCVEKGGDGVAVRAAIANLREIV